MARRRAPDPDDLDAACDLLLRGARYDDADERTTLYLFLALRDRQHLLACPNDAKALMTWGRRLLTFPDAGGLGRSSLHDMLELELLNRVASAPPGSAPRQAPQPRQARRPCQLRSPPGSVAPPGSFVPWSRPPLQLTAVLDLAATLTRTPATLTQHASPRASHCPIRRLAA